MEQDPCSGPAAQQQSGPVWLRVQDMLPSNLLNTQVLLQQQQQQQGSSSSSPGTSGINGVSSSSGHSSSGWHHG